MSPATITIVSSVLTALIGKLIDGYFARSKKYPKYIGAWPMLKNKLKKEENRMETTNWRTRIGCIIVFLGGVIAMLKGGIAEPFDPNAIWIGATAAAGAFAGWELNQKGERIMKALKGK